MSRPRRGRRGSECAGPYPAPPPRLPRPRGRAGRSRPPRVSSACRVVVLAGRGRHAARLGATILTRRHAVAISPSRWHSSIESANRGDPPGRINAISRPEARGQLMKFRPLHDRVVVRRIESEERTKGGIIIPDSAKEKPQEGEVIAVGAGARDENGRVNPLDVKAGDRVLFGKWSGTEVKIDGEDLLIMKESDIMGVVAL
ncbi:hypothetical protein Lal_00046482 [Lupinus albus]|nr:hypothetical protein Lal_00046482 [Lupinus albus]